MKLLLSIIEAFAKLPSDPVDVQWTCISDNETFDEILSVNTFFRLDLIDTKYYFRVIFNKYSWFYHQANFIIKQQLSLLHL